MVRNVDSFLNGIRAQGRRRKADRLHLETQETISSCLERLSRFACDKVTEPNGFNEVVVIFLDMSHGARIIKGLTTSEKSFHLRWSTSPDDSTMAAVYAMAQRLARLCRPAVVVLGTPALRADEHKAWFRASPVMGSWLFVLPCCGLESGPRE